MCPKCSRDGVGWDGVGHSGMGWGGSCRGGVGQDGVGWVMTLGAVSLSQNNCAIILILCDL